MTKAAKNILKIVETVAILDLISKVNKISFAMKTLLLASLCSIFIYYRALFCLIPCDILTNLGSIWRTLK